MLADEILSLSKQIANPDQITSACIFMNDLSTSSASKTTVNVLIVVKDFQQKLRNYMKTLGKRNIIFVAVDKWVFERDVDRGFLGEALAWRLILPYLPLVSADYLRIQEVKLKKRLVTELLENLVLDFPYLSYEFRIRPEYFVYAVILNRVRLFPPIASGLWEFTSESNWKDNVNRALHGYLEALRELERDGFVSLSNGYVQMSEKFVDHARSPKTRIINLSKTVPRALFTSLLGILPILLDAFSADKEILMNTQRFEGSALAHWFQVPEKYVFIPTGSGLVPLNSRSNVETLARRAFHVGKETKITFEETGGILNDVYLLRVCDVGSERRIVVKRFKDWSSFKWFPLTLWSVGTRSFAVLGRPRLERECAMNQFLYSKGFAVPKLLYASPAERLVFMEYIDGENASNAIKRLINLKTAVKAKRELKLIERIGRKLAKVHSLDVTLGDTKPENIMIGKNSEIILTDFEQSSRRGDPAWDVSEFLYYAGHYFPPFADAKLAETVAETFVAGYLEAGGNAEVVRKAGNPKYTKVFSVFTLPHIMLAISNVCRRTKPRQQQRCH